MDGYAVVQGGVLGDSMRTRGVESRMYQYGWGI